MRASLPLRILAVVCVLLGILPLANLLTNGAAIPWWGSAVHEWRVRGCVVLALATLLAMVLGARVDGLFDRARRDLLQMPSSVFAISIAMVAFAAAAFYARFCFSGQPFTTDEMAQQWHARILLSGHLAATAEPWREFFNTAPVFDRGGRWFSQYPFGGPAFIAAGMAFKAVWLVNPILLGFATCHLYRFLAIAFDELTARVTSLVFVASPMVLIMAASQMNHVPALAFTTLALAALARWDRAEDPGAQRRHAVIIGCALGVVAAVRPLDAIVLALVIGSFQLWRARQTQQRWHSLAVQLLAGALPLALLLWVNARTTGSPFLFGYDALNGPEHSLGFHMDPSGQVHTPRRALTYASGYVMRLSRFLFEWPIPGVLTVVAGLVAIRRATRWDVLLAALAAGIMAAYSAYWFDAFFAGPRFLFTALPAFVYFAARAPGAIAATIRWPVVRRVVLLVVPLCILTAWIGPNGVSSARGRTALYRAQRTKLKTDVDAQIERAKLRNALVFVNEGWRGRLLARLRVLGLTQFRAERVVSTLDACALQMALDSEDTLMARGDDERASRVLAKARAYGEARLETGFQMDQAIALVPGKRPTKRCVQEFQRDVSGTMAFPLFLARQSVGRDGRIGGNVVFARDFGARNERLRERFGDRVWFNYRAPGALTDTALAFLPYQPSR